MLTLKAERTLRLKFFGVVLKLASVGTSTHEWGDAEGVCLKSIKEVVGENRTDWEKDWAEVKQMQVVHYVGENS